jgi:hypothetical protein
MALQLPSPPESFGQWQRGKKNLTPNFVGGAVGLAMTITRVVQKEKTTSTHALLADFAWDFFHPPYSLDLAPSAFHLFIHLKQS